MNSLQGDSLREAVDAAVSAFGATSAPKLSSGVGEPEDQIRGPFETLLTSVGQSMGRVVIPVGEASLSDLKIRPDYAVLVGGAVCGHVEIKAPGKGANPSSYRGHDKRQWERLKALPNVLYTDGNEWALFRSGERVDSVIRLRGEIEIAGDQLSSEGTELAACLADFLSWQPVQPRTAEQLAVSVAGLCRLLYEEVLDNLAHNLLLQELAQDWRDLLFPDASDEKFADGYAQSVTFALLLARAEGIDFRGKSIEEISRELGSSHSLLGRALRVLTNADVIGGLRTSVNTLLRVVTEVSWEAIRKGGREPWLMFYEHFLARYNPELRKRTGSYYTPNEVVSAMTWMVDDVLRTQLGKADGFASSEVTSVDPAMGTGTFLLQMIEHAADRIEAEQGAGAVPARLREMLQRVVGFEIQMGPYAVAELRSFETFRRRGVSVPEDVLRLYVTNTLDNPWEEQIRLGAEYEPIAKSRRLANQVKANEPVTVVIGNPPYKDKAKGKGGWVESGNPEARQRAIFDDFLPPKEWGVGIHARHAYNMYAYFWRWAVWKAFEAHPESDRGVVAFITSASWLDSQGFMAMRKYMRDLCDRIYVLHLEGESRGARRTENVFEIQVPVAIVIAVRDGSRAGESAAVQMYTKTGTRGEKLAWLNELRSLGDIDWMSVDGDPTDPIAVTDPAWRESPLITQLFPWRAKGIMAGRTWVYAPLEKTLATRWERLILAPAEQKPLLLKEHPRDRTVDTSVAAIDGMPEIEFTISEETKTTPVTEPIGLRSFDRQFVIADSRVINQASPSLWQTRSDTQVFATTLSAEEISSGPAVTCSAFIPDAHHYRGFGGGDVIPAWSDQSARKPNVSAQLLDLLSSTLSISVSGEDLFAYVVGVAGHAGYTKRFYDELAIPGVRIPITRDSALFKRAVDLGKEVIWLQTRGERYVDNAQDRPSGVPPLPDYQRPKVQVAISDDSEHMPEEMTYNSSGQALRIGEGVVAPVSEAVFEYEVSGMNVLKKWFGYRKRKPAVKRSSALDDIVAERWPSSYTSDLLDLLNCLTRLVALEPGLDRLLSEILHGDRITVTELRESGAFDELTKKAPASGAEDDQLFDSDSLLAQPGE